MAAPAPRGAFNTISSLAPVMRLARCSRIAGSTLRDVRRPQRMTDRWGTLREAVWTQAGRPSCLAIPTVPFDHLCKDARKTGSPLKVAPAT